MSTSTKMRAPWNVPEWSPSLLHYSFTYIVHLERYTYSKQKQKGECVTERKEDKLKKVSDLRPQTESHAWFSKKNSVHKQNHILIAVSAYRAILKGLLAVSAVGFDRLDVRSIPLFSNVRCYLLLLREFFFIEKCYIDNIFIPNYMYLFAHQ